MSVSVLAPRVPARAAANAAFAALKAAGVPVRPAARAALAAAAVTALAPVPAVSGRSPTAGSGPLPRLYSVNAVVSAVRPNPKKPGSASYARFAHYAVGLTVAECLSAGVTAADLRWDLARGFVTLG